MFIKRGDAKIISVIEEKQLTAEERQQLEDLRKEAEKKDVKKS